jgi:hypothetical protein
MAFALEGFLEDITKKAAKLCQDNQDTKVLPQHLKEICLREPQTYGFLKPHFAGVPDLELIEKEERGCKRKAKEAAKSKEI